MSDLQTIAQQVSSFVSSAESATALVRTYSAQVNQMLVMVKNAMQGTSQQSYQDLLNQLSISKKKLDYATDCLLAVSQDGKEWIGKHTTGNASGASTAPLNSFINPSTVSGNSEGEDPFKPTRTTPRDLTVSQYGFTTNASGMEVYDSPLEVDKYLYSKQGSAYKNFKGTCGLCSCANVLRLAGVDYGEKEMIEYAADPQGGLFSPKLCTVNPFSASASGGTTPKQRQQILDHFGVSSSIWSIKTDADGRTSMETINDIANWVSEGRGVIVDVDAGIFYNSPPNYGNGHAVTITSVEKNKYGDVTAFYILDSNQGTVKLNAWDLQDTLRTFVGINVTSQIIR